MTPLFKMLLLLVSAVGIGACGAAPQDSVAVVEYDSAGIAMTVNSAGWPYPLPSISIDPVPITAIETREDVDAIPFFRMGGATRLPTGEVVVGDAGEVAVRVFSQSGAALRRFSRFGHGPGELPSIDGVTHWGDTIVVFAAATRIAALFDPNGDVLGRLRLHTAARGIADVHRLSDGTWIGRGYLTLEDALPPESGYGRRVTPIVLLNAYGSETARLRTFPDAYTYTTVLKRTKDLTYVDDRPVPFSPKVSFATDGQSIYAGTGETYQIEVLNREGRTVRIIRRSWTAQEVTARERTALARLVGELGSRSAADEGAVEWINAHSRQHVPPYSRLVVDARGLLWVAEFPVSHREPRWWAVYDRKGRLMGDIQVPPGLDVIEIGEDYILGVIRDELGRESLYVYALQRE